MQRASSPVLCTVPVAEFHLAYDPYPDCLIFRTDRGRWRASPA